MVKITISPQYPRKILRNPLIIGTFIGFIIASGIFSILSINQIWGMFLFAWGIILFMSFYYSGDKE